MPEIATLEQLIDRFHHDPQRRKPSYNETEVRVQYINPLFRLLGWDMANVHGRGEVRHEDKITIGNKAKAPDYGFYLDGRRRFFVEAKKPSVNLDQNHDPAYQLRRYAWTAKLPLSILTDFEEFAVYDTRVRPGHSDNPKVARLRYWNYADYGDKWDEIVAIFSREAVLAGSLDEYAAKAGGKKGVAPVDAEFLKEIERWRELLARNIALRNPGLDERDLNFAVQQTIDRLLFLRIAEDRGIEPYGRLRDLTKGGEIYTSLFTIFNQADARYNSGLFHFQPEKGRDTPDRLTPGLNIDDKALKDIIRNLYEPVSPYEFSVFPADILGQVYEQFLGKVIRLTGKSAKVEDKPEVKKAGGVYYTPTYIVDYIVRQTVGKLLEGHAPDPTGPASRLRILDPACGSGSFLLGAYDYLLDWHLRGYLAAPSKWSKGRGKTLYQTAGGDYHLTLAERKRILLDNLYGVDIDPQAVEVTKLSLLLKVLEETPDALSGQLSLLPERVLPDLGDNIKCGNSLIGPDFYDGQATLFDLDERMRVNAFDWNREFRGIMNAGGFDAVIGNPPYVRQEMLGEFKGYFSNRFEVFAGTADLYAYFIERGISLLKPGGIFGYIVANKWMRANYGRPLRAWLTKQDIVEITDFGDLPVFEKATTYPCVLIIRNAESTQHFRMTQVDTLSFVDLAAYVENHSYQLDQTQLGDDIWSLVDEAKQRLATKLLSKGVSLGEYVNGRIYRGIVTGLNKAFVIDERTRNILISEDPNSEDLIKPFVEGRDVKRYAQLPQGKYLIFTRRGVQINKYPAVKRYLSQFREFLEPRPSDWKGKEWKGRKPGRYKWFEIQDSIEYHAEFSSSKIVIPSIIQKAAYTFDEEGFYSNQKTTIIVNSSLYLLGVLNSKPIDYFIQLISSTKQGGYFEYNPMYLKQLPIRTIDFTDPADTARHDRMVALVQAMLDLHKQHAAELNPHKKSMLQHQIDATDRQIDRLVYDLYGLTAEEIAIVEGQDG